MPKAMLLCRVRSVATTWGCACDVVDTDVGTVCWQQGRVASDAPVPASLLDTRPPHSRWLELCEWSTFVHFTVCMPRV